MYLMKVDFLLITNVLLHNTLLHEYNFTSRLNFTHYFRLLV